MAILMHGSLVPVDHWGCKAILTEDRHLALAMAFVVLQGVFFLAGSTRLNV